MAEPLVYNQSALWTEDEHDLIWRETKTFEWHTTRIDRILWSHANSWSEIRSHRIKPTKLSMIISANVHKLSGTEVAGPQTRDY